MLVVSLLLLACAWAAPASILEYGAIPNNDSFHAVQTNNGALRRAFIANRMNGVVLVPEGNDFFFTSANLSNAINFTLVLDGRLVLPVPTKEMLDAWPMRNSNAYVGALVFENVSQFTITSHANRDKIGDYGNLVNPDDDAVLGGIDGHGYWWWWDNILQIVKPQRPNLIDLDTGTDVELSYLLLEQSPRYHVDMSNVRNVFIHHNRIEVNVTEQAQVYRAGGFHAEASLIEAGVDALEGKRELGEIQQRLGEQALQDNWIPTFPLNTDGFDVAGQGVVMSNNYVRNADDCYCLKPGRISDGWCSENYLIENNTQVLGVGHTIGSIPATVGTNCARNVMFRNGIFQYPIKSAYIKSNPPSDASNPGDGLIQNISYINMTATVPIWDVLYVSIQQQSQPGGGGPGWWPIVPGYVTIKDIFFQDWTVTDGLWLWPGVFRANETNPYSNIVLDNVNIKMLNATENYYCENIVNSTVTNSFPHPTCF